MQGFLDYMDAAYGTDEDGFLTPARDLRLSEADPEGRRILGRWTQDRQFVLEAKPVGGRNAGAFLGWVTLSRADWRRVQAPRPNDWESYTVVIGYAPDDETIWWSAIYNDDKLRVLEPELMEGGRWVRFGPEQAAKAMVAVADASPLAALGSVQESPVPTEKSKRKPGRWNEQNPTHNVDQLGDMLYHFIRDDSTVRKMFDPNSGVDTPFKSKNVATATGLPFRSAWLMLVDRAFDR